MVLDPFTALGLAGNLVQFVDFLYKLLSESKSLYASSSGVSAENVILETVAKDLSLLSAKLATPPSGGLVQRRSSQAGEELRILASLCQDVTKQLLGALEELKIKSPDKRWKSFLQALKTVWRKEKIEELAKRVDRAQRQLNTRLLAMMSDQQSVVLNTLLALEDEGRRMELDGVKRLRELQSHVLDSIRKLKPEAAIEQTTVQELIQSIRKLQPVKDEQLQRFSEAMQDLSASISRLAESGNSIALEQKVIKSLWFKSLNVRHAKVAEAHAETFSWIFEDASQGHSGRAKFHDWLQFEGGIYWIMGKAGSGKSTLMKYLYHHQRTTEALKSWASSKKLIVAKFFFWNAGTSMQKSQEGLLQSLLYQVLRQCPGLTRSAVASSWEMPSPLENNHLWTRDELLEALKNLLQQAEVPVKFCFFIDGLDEYDGDHPELVKVLQMFPVSPDIKLCISSRPWTLFKDAFGRNANLSLTLEELTQGDIKLYVKTKLEEDPGFMKLKAKDNRSQELIQELVDKANGVFLWVFLVVRSLLSGLNTSADRMCDLQDRLRCVPRSLDDYFRHILDSVDEGYQKQTAQAFQIALRAWEPLSLIAFSFLDEEDPNFALRLDIDRLKTMEINERHETMERRLDARCKGLLEVSKDWSIGRDPRFEYKVDFLHRTVRDFLRTTDMQNMLANRISSGFNAEISLCKCIVAQMKTIRQGPAKEIRDNLDDLLVHMLGYAHTVENETGNAQVALLDEAERVLWMHPAPWRGPTQKNAFLGEAVRDDLQLYVTRKLTTHPQLISEQGRPLLDIALNPESVSLYGYTNSGCAQPLKELLHDSAARPRDHRYQGKLSPSMVQLLLTNGASPNQNYRGGTVWGRFICSLERVVLRDDATDQNGKGVYLQVLESLLLHGAEPEKALVFGDETLSRQRDAEGIYSLPDPPPNTYIDKTPKDIIVRKFSREDAEWLLSKARPRRRSLVAWIGKKF